MDTGYDEMMEAEFGRTRLIQFVGFMLAYGEWVKKGDLDTGIRRHDDMTRLTRLLVKFDDGAIGGGG